MNIRRNSGLLGLVILLLAGFAPAQDSKKETQLRMVSGTVLDKSENPMPDSVVFLRNVRTNTVSSRIADKNGIYRFSGLDPNADYEIHAELDGAKSQVKTMSALDGRKELTLNLKLDRKK